MDLTELTRFIKISEGGISIDCWIQPKACKTAISGVHGISIKITVAAPPEDGKANAELCAFLSKKLGIPKSSVQIKSGHASRRKIVFCSGASKEKFLSCIP
jgi:uncharacterized protein (TIGR00251 family)